jgi:putative ABC transport system permease protein
MPDWKQEIRARLAGLKLPPTREAEIVEELSQHLEDRYRELLSERLSELEARSVLLAELQDSRLFARELMRAEQSATADPVVLGTNRRSNMVADFWQDLRYGTRMIVKKPGFAAVAVLATALGIGANTTIFSTADAMLFRPFSFPNQSQLVSLFERKLAIGITNATVSPGNVIEWREQSQTLEQIVAMRNRDVALMVDGLPERYTAYLVSATFFDALGVQALMGRTFQAGEDEPGRAQVAVLRHAFWQNRFGSDPQIVGREIRLDNTPFTVIGVMPENFDFPYGGGEFWTPLVFDAQMKREHGNHYLRALALLKPGVSVAQANADLDRISQEIEERYPDGEAGHSAFVSPLNDWYTRGVRVAMPAMIGSAIFMLLIACSNVANLLLVRASAREKEIAVRLALGASRWRLIRQLLTESIMLALAGGALGTALAGWGIEALARIIPIGMSKFIPGSTQLGLNYRVLAFTASISVLTGVLFGLVPALQATRTDLNQALKQGGSLGRAGKSGSNRMRNVLVVAELALSLVLLIGAGLTVRSFIRILDADLGVKPDGVVTMNLALARDKYPEPQQRRNFFDQLLKRVSALPGVANSGAVHALPMSGRGDGNSVQIVGQPVFERGKEPHTEFRIATPGYFAAIGTEVLSGRSFNEQDDAKATPIVLANEAFAARFLKGADPVGQRMTLGGDTARPLEIIGVVANVMNDDMDDLAEPCVYLPFAQHPVGGMNLVVRTQGQIGEIAPALRRVLAEIDDGLALGEIKALAEVIDERRSPKNAMMWMLVVFGLMALAMAAVGIYAVVAFSVAERTKELGIRIALGAQAADVFKLVLKRGFILALIGIGLGLAGAFAMTRSLASLLFSVTATDPLTFAGVSSLLVFTALLACYIPARRATKVDPMTALRNE